MKAHINGFEQFIKFGMVGLLNTIVGTVAMLFAYNVLHMGYWVSSALNYILGSVLSYILNKNFTFRSKKKSKGEIFRFVTNILVCYLIAYGVAEPFAGKMFSVLGLELEKKILEQVAMLFGMCFFIILNFFGQKIFVFKRTEGIYDGKSRKEK